AGLARLGRPVREGLISVAGGFAPILLPDFEVVCAAPHPPNGGRLNRGSDNPATVTLQTYTPAVLNGRSPLAVAQARCAFKRLGGVVEQFVRRGLRGVVEVASLQFGAWVCVLAGASSAMAQTTVGGPVETDVRWSLAQSPFLLTQDLTVRGGATLTIDAGVQVYVASGVRLTVVSGAVRALGTAQSPVRFTSEKLRQGGTAASGEWGPWLFTAQGSASSLDHV